MWGLLSTVWLCKYCFNLDECCFAKRFKCMLYIICMFIIFNVLPVQYSILSALRDSLWLLSVLTIPASICINVHPVHNAVSKAFSSRCTSRLLHKCASFTTEMYTYVCPTSGWRFEWMNYFNSTPLWPWLIHFSIKGEFFVLVYRLIQSDSK